MRECKIVIFVKRVALLVFNYLYDIVRFYRFSSVFSNNTSGKVLGKIIFYYHSIEKGLINDPIRFRFGEEKIKKLKIYLKIWIRNSYSLENSQFITACSVLCHYYNLHVSNGYDISDIVSEVEYNEFVKLSDLTIGGYLKFNYHEYFKYTNFDFNLFSASRHSIRHFSGASISTDLIIDAVKLSMNAPSVCNRQSVEIRLVNNETLVEKVLKIQSGINASANKIKQVLIVTSNINFFVSEVERNQMFVDGGIFLQNLLYSLHYYQIGACALNWSKPFYYEKKIHKVLDLDKSLRVIAIIAIGKPLEAFKVPYSNRKKISEIFQVIQ